MGLLLRAAVGVTAAPALVFVGLTVAALGAADKAEGTIASAGPNSCGVITGAGATPSSSTQPGGFGQWKPEQVQNATEIARVGMKAGVGAWGVTVGLATAMQESQLKDIPGGDRDSVGIMQGRPSQGWGTPAQLLDTQFSAMSFFGVNPAVSNPGLTDVPGWQNLPLTVAAQRVQRSGFPEAYAKWETPARDLAQHVINGNKLTAPAGATTVEPVNCTTTGGGVAPSGNWTNPLASAVYNKSSKFGMRYHPLSHSWKLHGGQDMAAPTGVPIHAACKGRVTSVRWSTRGGNVTTVDCGGGISTHYKHQSSVDTKVGVAVAANAPIGKVGSTGGSTGPHLHFEVEVNGSLIDPVPFMKKRGVTL